MIDLPQHGLCGGYLVLNRNGRPLEFHCTAPLKPNRAQQILYGATLEPFLYGEQIGQTLVNKAKQEVLVVCTDRPAALAVREYIDRPVALVLPRDDGEQPPSPAMPSSRATGLEKREPLEGHGLLPPLFQFRIGANRLAVPESAADDHRLIVERLGELADGFDLAEPFQRIAEAIDEAHRAARAAA